MIIARVHDFDVRLNGSSDFYKKNRGKETLKPFSASQFALTVVLVGVRPTSCGLREFHRESD